MRQLRRPKVLVPTLAPGGAGGKKRAAQIREYERSATPPSSFPRHWAEPDVRGALRSMQGRVCAYCGADIAETGVDVEHFRPKGEVAGEANPSGYWWLAYDFENYLLSCTVCNQRYKGSKFPLSQGASRICYEDRHRLGEELRILLDPTVDPVESWISVNWQNPAGRLMPNPEINPDLAERVKRVLQFFRVDRRVEQRRKRMAVQRLVIERIAEGKADEARTLAIRYRPHSLVARQILEAKAPEVLPTPLEELQWLLDTLSSELLEKLADLNDSGTTQLDEKEAKELIWALAVLWKDPPAGTPDSIREYLDRKGLTGLVEQYLSLL